ncbi:MAG: hypothetical protein K9K21_12500 [Desulfotignum sp.]|nr:hypothetical protein [Desulfotignum sp.]MCF8114662.1 hypothetical protein [Desulfotignum sp.]
MAKRRITRKLIRGVGSVLEIHPRKKYQVPSTDNRSDAERLSWDWFRVGRDISKAMSSHNHVKK